MSAFGDPAEHTADEYGDREERDAAFDEQTDGDRDGHIDGNRNDHTDGDHDDRGEHADDRDELSGAPRTHHRCAY